MRLRKPPGVYTKSFVFRPGKALHGKFSVGLGIESIGVAPTTAIFEWCGSKRVLAFGPAMSGFMTNLRLPQNLNEGDVYVLSVSGRTMLIISVGINGEEEAVQSVAIEEFDDGPSVPTVCADPMIPGDRSCDEILASGSLVKPARFPVALGRIESLRPFPDGCVLILNFGRPADAGTEPGFLIDASVGGMRNLGFMSPGRSEVNVCFRLQPAEAGETWPLTLHSDRAFTWSATVHRNFDTNFLPAFSLVI